jgi:3'-phosphoadenosine 5'-phosphosulfate (PAPS) 3'-phosphatase
VLSSPKITDTEVEAFARMTSVTEDILRTIAGTRGWIKNYTVCLALVKNSKTPVAISMNLMPRLMEKDLRLLASDRNVAEVLRTTARRRLASTEKR